MNTISFFEHQFLAYSDMPGFPKNIRRKEHLLEQLEQLNRSSGKKIFDIGYNGLRAQALVGVVRVGDITFEILPKVDDPSQTGGAPEHSAVRNLLYMLSYTARIQIHKQDFGRLGVQPGAWFELLTRWFANGLYREVISGLSHAYESVQDSQPVLRGRWDIQRQLTHPHLSPPEFDIIVDDFTPDIPMNRIFRWVIELLYQITKDEENRLLLGELREWFRGVTLLPQLDTAYPHQVHFNRLNDRFQPAFNLAHLFLTASTVLPSGGETIAYAFTFDMNILFEQFLTGLIKRHSNQILPETWQSSAILAQAEGIPVYLAQTSEKIPVIYLKPDLLIKKPGSSSPIIIVDFKYKLSQPTSRGTGLSEEDVYQMLAYAAGFNCPHLLLIFPQQTIAGKFRQELFFDSPRARLLAGTINLRQPLDPPTGLLNEIQDLFNIEN